ncbi:ABC transporter ATP-binding protein [Legionella clemsonensis]|uniref:Putative ABC transporter ATP-binding protein n=1 Tax=Legionella clemsonensis TaxID=1867846 RepID=A0A222P5C2_9GAMM|nr:ABC transporter ATP-binding protein [Legionella clemsonensis]ASQ47051.1 putative ABC transporter ATP-binding protein [Legionella clemsonensis]
MSIINVFIINIRKQKLGFLLLLISSLFGALQQCLTPWLIKFILNNFQSKNYNHIPLHSFLSVFLTIYLISELIIRSQGILIAKVIPGFKENVKNFFLQRILNKDYGYFMDNLPGTIVQKLQDFTSSSERVLQIIIFNFFTIIVSFVLISILLFFITPFYTFLITAWFVIHIFSTYLRFNQSIKHIKNHHSIHSNISGNLNELLSKIITVKVFNGEAFELGKIKKSFYLEKKSLQKAQIYFEKIKIFQSILSILLIFILVSHQLNGLSRGKFQAGDFIFVIFITYNLINYVWFSSFQLTIFIREIGIIKNSFSILIQGNQDPHYTVQHQSHTELISSSPILEIKNLCFSIKDYKNIINDLSLKINFNQKVLLKGNSGAGKSTLVKLLTGLHTNYSGNIYIAGINIKTIPREELKKLIVLIEQNHLLFNRTIRENICYNNPNYTEEQLFTALNLACCHNFINTLPNGIDTKIGEEGILLSGGQTQRIAIARAILAQPKILILDESTSGLEKKLELQVISNLMTIKKQTLLVISHSSEIQTLMNKHILMPDRKPSYFPLIEETIC